MTVECPLPVLSPFMSSLRALDWSLDTGFDSSGESGIFVPYFNRKISKFSLLSMVFISDFCYFYEIKIVFYS